MKFIAKTFQGLEEVLAQELAEMGANHVRIIRRGVEFEGDKELLYRANFELRTALRILLHVFSFKARNENEFYDQIRRVDWSAYMDVKQTLAVDATVFSEYFTHSQYVALKTKDAIVDQFRDKTSKRPNVNTVTPDLRVNVHINRDCVDVLLDSSGDSLHRRGYRVDSLEAPINEVLAAGMVLLSGWDRASAFLDPMCGSGTILSEAALYAFHLPPQTGRDYFCFKRWKDFDSELWSRVTESAMKRKVEFTHPIIGRDLHFQAVRVSERNMEAAGLLEKIDIKRKDFFKIDEFPVTGTIITNPPYNERMEMKDDVEFYKMMGDVLKKKFKGWKVWIISSNLEALKQVGLHASKKIPLLNGSLECKFVNFNIY